MFGFTVLIGLVRVFAYAGSPIGQELSVASLLHALALHVLTFALGMFAVAFLSRATLTRAAWIALYAQAVLLLGAFVDIGLGSTLSDFTQAYVGIFGGSPGSILGAIAYGGTIAWGVLDATIGPRGPRIAVGGAAGIVSALALSFLAIPWPRLVLSELPGWSLHLFMTVYYTTLAAALVSLGARRANPSVFRGIWREIAPIRTVGFAILPFVGILAAGRLIVPQVPNEPVARLLIELPYAVAASVSAAALWAEWRLIRARRGNALRFEGAAVMMVAALAFSLPLGVAPFAAAAFAGILAWSGRSPRYEPVLGILASCAFLAGNLTVVAVAFGETPAGPVTFLVPLDQSPDLSLSSALVGGAIGLTVAVLAPLTIRTSG